VSNKKLFTRLAALTIVVGLMVAVGAGAYSAPGTPGSAGGPPTAPNGSRGNSQTSAGATALGTLLAGYTGSELVNIQTFTINVHFPKGGTIYGRVGAPGIGEFGEGFAGRANRGFSPMSLSLSAKGRSYLSSINGQAVTLTVKYAFQPNKGKTQFSTVQIVTDP
jgi:hypothetical protein